MSAANRRSPVLQPPARPVLLLNLGNTRLHGAVMRGGRLAARFTCPVPRGERAAARALDLVRDGRAGRPEEAWVASVNPAALAVLVSFLRTEGLTVRRAGRDLSPPLRLRVARPAAVGWDRVANATAAFSLARAAAVCVDAGTAITVDVVTAGGDFLGGAIAPGLASMARAMARECAALPLIVPRPTRRGVGRDTREAMRAGVVLGAAGMVDRLVAEARRRIGVEAAVFLTGGDRRLLRGALHTRVRIEADLTLLGLARFSPGRPAARAPCRPGGPAHGALR